MSLAISVDRTTLSKSALVFSTPDTGLWVPEDGLTRPARTARKRYAPESPWLHGSTLISSVMEQSSLPFTGYAQAVSQSALVTLMDDVDEALSQFAYEVTVTENGVQRTWACDPADIAWGDYDSGMSAAKMARATITIPVYPFPVA